MMHSRRTPAVAALATAVAALAGLNLSCGGGSPTKSTPVTTPTTTPVTTPTTTPPPAASCRFGKGVFYYYRCDKESSELLPMLQRAMDRMIAANPTLFDL